MATSGSERVRCQSCERRVDAADAIKIVVERRESLYETVLCEECTPLRCSNCGTSIDVAGLLGSRSGIWSARDLYECDRCGERVPATDAVEIRHKENRSYRKLVCADCLEEIPIPPNMRVVRDLT